MGAEDARGTGVFSLSSLCCSVWKLGAELHELGLGKELRRERWLGYAAVRATLSRAGWTAAVVELHER